MTQMAAGLGLLELGSHRPALRPAQPLRSAADDRRPVTAAARDRCRRGHRGRGGARGASRGAPSRRQGCGDDPRPARITTNAFEAKRSAPILASGVVLHMLPAGSTFDLTDRTLIAQQAEVDRRGRRGDRRGRARPPADGARHRSRRRLAERAAPASRSHPPEARPQAGRDPGRSHVMTERPTPDLTILETRVYRGANIWSYEKAIHLVVDLGRLEEFPTNTIPGFTDHLLEMLPGLREHSCSRGKRGGFVERLNEGTWLGHVAEHTALALQQVVGHDIRRGKTRGVKGQKGHYNVIFGYADEQVGLAAGPPRRPAGQPPGRGGSRLRLVRASSSRSSCAPSGRRSGRRRRRSSTRPSPVTSRGSGSTSTRWCSSARASTPSGSAPR